MKVTLFLWIAALAVLLPSCKKTGDAARLASLRERSKHWSGLRCSRWNEKKDELVYQVSKRGNPPEQLYLVDSATRTCLSTQSVLNRLDSLQEAFMAGAGPATDAAPHPDYAHPFYPARAHGSAFAGLEEELQKFISILNPTVASRAAGIIGPDGALAQLRSETSLAAALSRLWEMKLETVACASGSLENLRVSSPNWEEILPYPVVDVPREVPEGDTLLMGIVLRGIIPLPRKGRLEMTCDGKPVVVERGIGKVRFITQGPPGIKHWEAAIRVKLYGIDTVLQATQTYHVLPR